MCGYRASESCRRTMNAKAAPNQNCLVRVQKGSCSSLSGHNFSAAPTHVRMLGYFRWRRLSAASPRRAFWLLRRKVVSIDRVESHAVHGSWTLVTDNNRIVLEGSWSTPKGRPLWRVLAPPTVWERTVMLHASHIILIPSPIGCAHRMSWGRDVLGRSWFKTERAT